MSIINDELQRLIERFRADPVADIEVRLALLRAASRPGDALTGAQGPTAQGHISSAITCLERRREAVYLHQKK